MKAAKTAGIAAVALALSMVLPLAVSASGTSSSSSSDSSSKAKTPGINSIITTAKNGVCAQIKTQRTADKTLADQIITDIKGAKSDSSVTSGTPYQDVTAALTSFKTTLTTDDTNIKNADQTAKGMTGSDRATYVLNTIIPLLNTELSDLTAGYTTLNNVLPEAQTVASQLQTDNAGLTAFKSSAAPKKATIQSNEAIVSQDFSDSKTLINQIVTVANSNISSLTANSATFNSIETQLLAIQKTLNGIYDGSIDAADKTYKTDVQNKDYTDALAQLDNIISIQQTRISTLTTVKSQLQSILTQINTIVGSTTSSTSSTSSTASSGVSA